MKKEWKCDTCKNPCILILSEDDTAPDMCPFGCTLFDKWSPADAEPLPPTHSDIMTLWWRATETSWKKVDTYNSNSQDGPVYIFNSSADGSTKIERFDRYFALKEWFTNRESAIVPPEAK